MRNDIYAEKISLWLDDELSPAEVEELEAHLVNCQSCRQTYESMQRVDRLLRTAATRLVAPSPGFVQRFEARLAQPQSTRPWQIWLVAGALFLGTLLIFGGWALLGGLTLINASVLLLDAGIFYQGFVAFLESLAGVRVLVSLGSLVLRASFVVMQQPLFWIGVVVAVSTIGLWIWVVRRLSQRVTVSAEFLV